MSNALPWAWFGLTVLVLLYWAYASRYTSVGFEKGAIVAWDRWLHRGCVFSGDAAVCIGLTHVWHLRPPAKSRVSD